LDLKNSFEPQRLLLSNQNNENKINWKVAKKQAEDDHHSESLSLPPMFTFGKSKHSSNPAISVNIWSAGNPTDQHSKQTSIVTRFDR
jgi:hypothetical protein